MIIQASRAIFSLMKHCLCANYRNS